MGEFEFQSYGIKMMNIQAGSIEGVEQGVRDVYDMTPAMLTNSLFSDFIKANGLNVWKGKSTRDIICIEFDYGTRSYDEEIKGHKKRIKEVKADKKLSESEKERRIKIAEFLIQKAEEKKDKFIKISAQDIRMKYYTEGVTIHYKTHNKKGEVIKTEDIHYKMLYRSTGRAKKGSCTFVNEKLYDVAHNFLYMGIELPQENSPIVEAGAYCSLITSTIVGKVQIKPEEILVLKDVESFFSTKAISVEIDENKQCKAVPVDNYKMSNVLFDGQALIENSIVPEWADGYLLLRHHMFKAAAFLTHIQKFMKEYYGDKYETAIVKDMFDRDVRVKDIKMITTDNAIKFLKFDIDFEYWANWVRDNDSQFGIVKTSHESKLGNVQRSSYQMVNSLDMEIMPQVVEKSLDYIDKLKTDDEVFLDYLRKNTNFSNDFEVLVALCEQDKEFTRSEYFRDRKRKIIEAYTLNLKSGRTIQNADNLVIVGSPYAMLLHSVGEDALSDPTFSVEEGTIRCWTERFDDGEYLAEFRNPFNSKSNMGYLHNVYHEYFRKYFNFGRQIIAINMIETDFQNRNNGSDQDSDSIYTTNQKEIVEYAKYCYHNYATIVNNIPKQKNNYTYSLENYAHIDNKLASAQKAIGGSSNLAQIALTYTYNFKEQKYEDYVCILSVLAQAAIDNAKRTFDVDINAEIDRIKKDMNIDENGFPKFWMVIRPDFKQKKEKINNDLICPMNYIYDIDIKKHKSSNSTLPMSDFFVKYELDMDKRMARKIEEWIEKYSIDLFELYQKPKSEGKLDDEDCESNYLVLSENFDEMVEDLSKLNISNKYVGLFSFLIDRAFCITSGAKRNKNSTSSTLNNNRAILLKTLYSINPTALLMCFNKNNIIK